MFFYYEYHTPYISCLWVESGKKIPETLKWEIIADLNMRWIWINPAIHSLRPSSLSGPMPKIIQNSFLGIIKIWNYDFSGVVVISGVGDGEGGYGVSFLGSGGGTARYVLVALEVQLSRVGAIMRWLLRWRLCGALGGSSDNVVAPLVVVIRWRCYHNGCDILVLSLVVVIIW